MSYTLTGIAINTCNPQDHYVFLVFGLGRLGFTPKKTDRPAKNLVLRHLRPKPRGRAHHRSASVVGLCQSLWHIILCWAPGDFDRPQPKPATLISPGGGSSRPPSPCHAFSLTSVRCCSAPAVCTFSPSTFGPVRYEETHTGGRGKGEILFSFFFSFFCL